MPNKRVYKKFICECGGTYWNTTKQRHLRTNKHIDYVAGVKEKIPTTLKLCKMCKEYVDDTKYHGQRCNKCIWKSRKTRQKKTNKMMSPYKFKSRQKMLTKFLTNKLK